MFSALAAIARLAHDCALTLTITSEQERLHVIIAAKGDKPRAFAQPVRVTGTPEELDAELPAQLAAYAAQMQAPATSIALPAPEVAHKTESRSAPRKVAAKRPAAPKRAPRATKPPKAATPKPVRAPKPAKVETPRADLPGKPECLADLRALQAKHGAKLTRRKYIKEAPTGRRYEKLWKNFEAFVAEGAQGELPMEQAPPVAATFAETLSPTAMRTDAAWPFPDCGKLDAAPAEPKPRVIGPMASARPVTPTEEESTDGPDRDAA